MSFSLSPVFNGWQGFGTTGLPLNAGLLYTYAAGTTTPAATYTTSVGNVQNANPIVLGPDGRPPQEIWLQDGLSYKFQLNDSLNNPIATYDNIQSIGTLIQNFVTSTAFLTQADGRYPIYVGTAGGSSDALTATVSTSITALYNGMVVSLDAVTANLTATPTFTLTLGSTVTPTFTIVDNNLQPLSAAAIAGLGHKIFLGYNSIQGKWLLMNPQTILPNSGIASKRQTASIGPKDISGMPSFLPQTVTGLTLTTQNIVGVETTQTANVTTPVASPGIVTWTAHTLVGNQAVSFTTSGALPTGLTVGTTYYVVPTSITANTFQVSASPGGTAINFTGSTSGQSVAWAGIQNVLVGTAYYGNDGINGELNLVGQATTNFSFPLLTNNSTNYLYSTISNIGVFTHFATTLAPIVVYGSTTQPSITTGQITIDVLLCEAYLGNGSTAIETPMVIWGTATTSGGNITATQTYNYGKPPTSSTKVSGTLLKRTFYSTAGTFTWIKSAQTTSVNVKVKGGGGNSGSAGSAAGALGGGGAGGGGEGGYAEGIFDASAFNIQTITLASAGTSSFGSLISATAGATGGNAAGSNGGIGGAGGTGAGGDIQITGQAGASGGLGTNSATLPGGTGSQGAGVGGGKGGSGGGPGGNAGQSGGNGVNGGAGGAGGGGTSNGTTGQNGAVAGSGSIGWIIVEEFA